MTSLINRRRQTRQLKCVALTLAVCGLAPASNAPAEDGKKNSQDVKSPRDLIREEAPLDPLCFSDLVISVFTASHGENTNMSTGMLSSERRTAGSARR